MKTQKIKMFYMYWQGSESHNSLRKIAKCLEVTKETKNLKQNYNSIEETFKKYTLRYKTE